MRNYTVYAVLMGLTVAIGPAVAEVRQGNAGGQQVHVPSGVNKYNDKGKLVPLPPEARATLDACRANAACAAKTAAAWGMVQDYQQAGQGVMGTTGGIVGAAVGDNFGIVKGVLRAGGAVAGQRAGVNQVNAQGNKNPYAVPKTPKGVKSIAEADREVQDIKGGGWFRNVCKQDAEVIKEQKEACAKLSKDASNREKRKCKKIMACVTLDEVDTPNDE